jgi:hypothetical protein
LIDDGANEAEAVPPGDLFSVGNAWVRAALQSLETDTAVKKNVGISPVERVLVDAGFADWTVFINASFKGMGFTDAQFQAAIDYANTFTDEQIHADLNRNVADKATALASYIYIDRANNFDRMSRIRQLLIDYMLGTRESKALGHQRALLDANICAINDGPKALGHQRALLVRFPPPQEAAACHLLCRMSSDSQAQARPQLSGNPTDTSKVRHA